MMFKCLRTTSKHFPNASETQENIKNTFAKASGGGRMGHLLYGKENFEKDMKITTTVTFYVKLIAAQRIQYIDQHLFRFYILLKEKKMLQARFLKKSIS